MIRITIKSGVRSLVRKNALLFGVFVFLTASPNIAFGTPTPSTSVGSGTISFQLPARYGTGVSITSYLCQNTFLSRQMFNYTGSSAPEDPAMGIRGLLHGHSFQALFSATHTFVSFENVSMTPAMGGGPASTYVQGRRVSGTIKISVPNGEGSALGSGTVTIDLTCTGGSKSAATAIPPTDKRSSPSGTLLWIGLLIVAAIAGLAISRFKVNSRKPNVPNRCEKAWAEVQAAEADVKSARERGDAHYRAMGDLRLEGAILSEYDNRDSKFDQDVEASISKASKAAESRLARAREALRICLAGGSDFAPAEAGAPAGKGFDPMPPNSNGVEEDPTDRPEIG